MASPKVRASLGRCTQSWPGTSCIARCRLFASVGELVEAINAYLAEHNLDPKRYVWRKSGERILASIQRARQALAATNANSI